MSANNAVTVLRSPSGSESGAAGTDESAEGPPAFSAAPHAPQNLKRGGLSLPHPGQMLRRSDPQLPQNLVSDGLSYSQLGQSIVVRLFRQGTSLPNIKHARLGIPGSRRGARGQLPRP